MNTDTEINAETQRAQSPGQGADTSEAGEQQESNAAKLRARLDRLEDMYFHPEKYYPLKITQWEVKELRTHRPHLWKDDPDSPESSVQSPQSNIEAGNAEMALPSYVSSAAELAQVLDTYFRERISIEISPTLVGQWRKGLKVGVVFIDGKKTIPPSLPKNKAGNRFEVQPCLEWVEKWIVPQKQAAPAGQVGNGTVLPGTAMDFDRIKQEHAIWQMQREKDLSDGKFKSVEVFNQHLTSFGLAVNRALNEGEKSLKNAILKEIGDRSLKVEAEGQNANSEILADAVGRGVRAAVDALRAGVAKALMEAQEPEGLQESH